MSESDGQAPGVGRRGAAAAGQPGRACSLAGGRNCAFAVQEQ